MVSAVVSPGASIAITYNEPVTCGNNGATPPTAGAWSNFAYDYTVSSSGGVATGCSASGDVLTLTGAFNAPLGSASITYTAPRSSSLTNAVYAGTSAAPVYQATGTISGMVITG